jgi:hypothetical protein
MKSQVGELVPSTQAQRLTPLLVRRYQRKMGLLRQADRRPGLYQVYFGWRTSTVTPTCWLMISLNGGRVSHGRDRGGGVTSPSSSSLPEDSGSEGVSFLPCPRHHLGSTLGLSSLFPRLQCFVVGMVHFPFCHVLGQGDPPWCANGPTREYERSERIKLRKWPKKRIRVDSP